jgi:hypothetical protein
MDGRELAGRRATASGTGERRKNPAGREPIKTYPQALQRRQLVRWGLLGRRVFNRRAGYYLGPEADIDNRRGIADQVAQILDLLR